MALAGGPLWRLGATAWWPIGRPGPTVAVAHGACVRRARGRDEARSPRPKPARVAMACQWLPCCGVEGKGMRAVGGVRWARGTTARLTEEVGRR
jgi:hypothetical protein